MDAEPKIEMDCHSEEDGVEQCSRMLRLISRQISDLDEMRSHLQEKRAFWSDKLTTLQDEGPVQAATPRARRGELSSTVIAILLSNPAGLTLGEIDNELKRQGAIYGGRHSLSEALRRLKSQRKVIHLGEAWTVNLDP